LEHKLTIYLRMYKYWTIM